ncbi:hypothetical protein ACFXKY_10845 [Streptomyces canus]
MTVWSAPEERLIGSTVVTSRSTRGDQGGDLPWQSDTADVRVVAA